MVNLFLGLSRSPSKHPLHFGGKGERELNLAQKREMERNKKKLMRRGREGFLRPPRSMSVQLRTLLERPLGSSVKKGGGRDLLFLSLSVWENKSSFWGERAFCGFFVVEQRKFVHMRCSRTKLHLTSKSFNKIWSYTNLKGI